MPTPHPYEIDPSRRQVWVQAEGACTLADAKATLTAVDGDARVGPGFALLFDLRNCREELQLFEVEELARTIARSARSRGGPIAFVAQRTSAFGVAHMLASFVRIEGCRASAFQDLDAAVSWVDDLRH
jgi:hypothetical protein